MDATIFPNSNHLEKCQAEHTSRRQTKDTIKGNMKEVFSRKNVRQRNEMSKYTKNMQLRPNTINFCISKWIKEASLL
ncbi:CLUMA_CG021094, isoform A [Clunio marinus]|uniref:CLUMA_CG021094, isoform A n=1 Tax=Clunio marinus TaxID=568069 RepID=A0A1J1J7Z4_9DIPT|nr:CLUMA_CG021094, isoform A [Clunio marinus]